MRARIAVVDDDESVRRALSRLLRTDGWTSDSFASAEAFLEVLRSAEFACLIADIHLGRMSGLELAARLAELGCPIPVIIITAHDSQSARESARRLAVHGYFAKPLEATALLEAVRSAVERGARAPAGSPDRPQ